MANNKSDHDGGYKYLFSSAATFHQFLTRFVDLDFVRNLAVEDMKLIDRSIVSDQLKRRRSDIIYRCGSRNSRRSPSDLNRGER